jgi:RNA-binding protein YhbY
MIPEIGDFAAPSQKSRSSYSCQMNFTEPQLEILKTKARALKPIYIVAKAGIRANIIWGLSHQWGLVKIQFPTQKPKSLLAMAEELAIATQSQLLFTCANYAVYYRKHPTESVQDLFD